MSTTFYIDTSTTIIAESGSTDAPVIAVKSGETGYWPIYTHRDAAFWNGPGVTPAILESAFNGSMFGWDTKAARLAMTYAAETERTMAEHTAGPAQADAE